METYTVRASSWPELFDCPARWAAKNIDGHRMPTGGGAHIGTSLHKSTAAFDQAVLDGSPITIDDATEVLVETLHHPDDDIDWGDIVPRKIEPVAIWLHSRYCEVEAPRHDYVAVEALCDSLDVAVDDVGVTVRLTGTTDRVRRTSDGRLGVSDIKSGKSRVGTDGTAKTQGDGPQLGVYSILAEQALGERIDGPGEIIGLNTAKTLQGARVGHAEIPDPRLTLVGTEDRPGMIEIAAHMLKSGLFYGNPRSYLCSPKFCPVYSTCHFHD